MVMDFSLDSPAVVEVAISAQGSPEVYTFTLSQNQAGRRQMKWELPKDLGDDLRPALITVAATDNTGGFNLIGLGVGPRAVGSVAIDQLRFGPDGIHATHRETATYRFFSHSDFEKISAEFWKLGSGSHYAFVNSQPVKGGVGANRWIGDAGQCFWDGFDTRHRISEGLHKFLVRVWDSQGDWVTALSGTAVNVGQ